MSAQNAPLRAERMRAKYGPWAVIAGASEGTGAEYARQLAAFGIHCLLVARRTDPLQQIARELTETARGANKSIERGPVVAGRGAANEGSDG